MSLSKMLPVFLTVMLACQTVPVTKRKQLHLVPSSQLDSLAAQDYTKFIDSATVITGTPQSKEVKQVGNNIACAVEQYLKDHNMAQQIKDFSWEFNLIQDTVANAWAMPGGRVAVYTGILPIAQDTNGLAVVMAHEIAHVVAHHGDERMSQALLVQLGGITLAKALQTKPQLTRQLFLAAYGVGTELGILLPYSRLQESEADHLGLIFMSMAGYDPHAAIGFWKRMMQASNGPSAPEFLRTHPTEKNRLKDIEDYMPQAMKYYNKGKCQ